MGISSMDMTSILNAVSSARSFNAVNAGRSTMDNRVRTLNAEIRQDKARGMDTSKKSAQLEKLQGQLSAIEDSMGISKKKTTKAKENEEAAAVDNEETETNETQDLIDDFNKTMEDQKGMFDSLNQDNAGSSIYDIMTPKVDVKV